MKIQSLLCIALASTVSINAAALEIYKGHLVSHKEWSIGNVKGSFLLSNRHVAMPAAPNEGRDETIYIGANASAFTGSVGKETNVVGTNWIYFNNKSQESRTYYYQYSLCVEMASKNMRCSFYQDQIQLDAGGYLSDGHDSQLTLTFNAPGTYKITSNTSIANALNNLSMSTMGSSVAVIS